MERLQKFGHIKPFHSLEIKHSKIGLGFEKLDRDVFDPEKAYDRVAEAGVKWVRIQSGWARTEQEPGVYDFAWLDAIVENLLIRGLKPWICPCYGTVGDKASYLDYGYFGILGAEFDEDGRSTGEYTPKPAYYALQNVAAIFREDFDVVDLPVIGQPAPSQRVQHDDRPFDLITGGFSKPNGSSAFVYWKPTPLLTTTYDGTVTWQCAGNKGVPRLVDLLTGVIYKLPESMVKNEGNGCHRLMHLPVMDYPLLLAFGDFCV